MDEKNYVAIRSDGEITFFNDPVEAIRYNRLNNPTGSVYRIDGNKKVLLAMTMGNKWNR